MAVHSITLAWKIPWTEEPGRLQPMGSHRVGHNWSDLAAAVNDMIVSFQYPLQVPSYTFHAKSVQNKIQSLNWEEMEKTPCIPEIDDSEFCVRVPGGGITKLLYDEGWVCLPVSLLPTWFQDEIKMKSGYLGVFGLLAGTLKMPLLNRCCVTFKGKTEMWL